jgi:phosphate starvation-inducible membrane PsiE
VFSIIALLAMLIGNHTGKVEDLYLVGFALLLVLGVVISVRNKRNAWRR